MIGVTHLVHAASKLWKKFVKYGDRQQNQGRFNDIFEIEAIGPLILLVHFLKLFREA